MPTSQEPDHVSARRIVWIGAVSVAIGIAGIAVSRAIDRPDHVQPPQNAPATIGMLEQRSIGSTERGVELRNAQEASLHTYRWRDRDAGVAEIPIERAMQIVEERAR